MSDGPDADPASEDVDAPDVDPLEGGAAGMTRVSVGVTVVRRGVDVPAHLRVDRSRDGNGLQQLADLVPNSEFLRIRGLVSERPRGRARRVGVKHKGNPGRVLVGCQLLVLEHQLGGLLVLGGELHPVGHVERVLRRKPSTNTGPVTGSSTAEGKAGSTHL